MSDPVRLASNPRLYFIGWMLAYAVLTVACVWSLISANDLSLGRQPWSNLQKTLSEFSQPSILNAWRGNPRLEYRSDDGTLLRVEDERLMERKFLVSLAAATWATVKIATLGSLLAAVVALPLGLLSARNLGAPRLLQRIVTAVLNASRAVHTLVFGLVFVGIMGLGSTAGLLAIAAHSLGTYGKLYAESIETLDMGAIDAVRAVGASPIQVFFTAVWPAVLPQLLSSHLYIWEYNIRDATILGMVGAGGLGLLISEAVSLFQWDRLATILLVVIMLVTLFDAGSRRVRKALQ
ncbi:MAG: phosphonate ABC transporter, permease protein PhnE [Pseudomonadota bacterium]